MSTDRRKIRIINKSKDGVTIDLRKNGGIFRFSWKSFSNLFEINEEDNKTCFVKDDTVFSRFQKLINKSVYIFSSIKDKDNPEKTQLEALGKYFNELMTILCCTSEELNDLVINKYSESKTKKNTNKKKQKPRENKVENIKQEPNTTNIQQQSIPVSTFGDLKELQQLKEEMNDKRRS